MERKSLKVLISLSLRSKTHNTFSPQTINNTEKRYGTAVIGVLCVVLSAANAAYQYYNVDIFAGKLLGGTLLWLCTAAALITDTWRLNPVNEDGKLVPLYPVKGESETKFLWGAKEE